MHAARLTSSGLIFTQNDNSTFVLAIGGNRYKTCERYMIENDIWDVLPSFKSAVE